MFHQDNDPLLYWRHCEPTSLKCAVNMNLLCRCTNMFHPPPPPPPPPPFPTWRWTTTLSFFFSWETLKVENFHRFAFIIAPQGKRLPVFRFTTAYLQYGLRAQDSMCRVQYTNYNWHHGPGDTDWKITWWRKFLWGKKKRNFHFIFVFYYKAIMEMSLQTSSVTQGYSSVRNTLLWNEAKAHLFHRVVRGGKK